MVFVKCVWVCVCYIYLSYKVKRIDIIHHTHIEIAPVFEVALMKMHWPPGNHSGVKISHIQWWMPFLSRLFSFFSVYETNLKSHQHKKKTSLDTVFGDQLIQKLRARIYQQRKKDAKCRGVLLLMLYRRKMYTASSTLPTVAVLAKVSCFIGVILPVVYKAGFGRCTT